MKIAVIGAGAMGSVYAGLLANAGNEVHAIDIREEHIDEINKNGLRITGASGDKTVRRIHGHTSSAAVGICDLVIIATKASGVAGAAQSAAELIDGQSSILTIQNGLGAEKRIQSVIQSENILLGVAAGFGASVIGPGHVHHENMASVTVGKINGGLSNRIERVVRTWRDAGFNIKAFDDIHRLIWEKFVCNVAFSGPCTVFDMTLGELMGDPHAWEISKTCGVEAYKAGVKKKINFTFSDPVRHITRFGEKMPDARPSMLQDHLANRKSEIDVINGMVPAVAQEVGMTAPYNEVVSAIIRSRESKFQQTDG